MIGHFDRQPDGFVKVRLEREFWHERFLAYFEWDYVELVPAGWMPAREYPNRLGKLWAVWYLALPLRAYYGIRGIWWEIPRWLWKHNLLTLNREETRTGMLKFWPYQFVRTILQKLFAPVALVIIISCAMDGGIIYLVFRHYDVVPDRWEHALCQLTHDWPAWECANRGDFKPFQ